MISAAHREAVAAVLHGAPVDVALVLVRWRKVGPFNLTMHTSRRVRSKRSAGSVLCVHGRIFWFQSMRADGRLSQRLRANIAGAAEMRRSTVGGDRPRASPLLRAVGLLHKRRVAAAPSSERFTLAEHAELSGCVGTGPAGTGPAGTW